MNWVVDTSVAAKWYFNDEKDYAQAQTVLTGLILSPNSYFVPDLFYTELAAVLVKKSAGDQDFTQRALDLVFRLGMRTIPTGGDLLKEAVAISCNTKMSVYDAIYLTVSDFINARWITADRQAYRKVIDDHNLKSKVCLLEQFE